MRDAELRSRRVAAQGLGTRRAGTVLDAVHRVVGLQAQDVRACRLSVRVRTEGLTQSDVDDAVNAGTVVRTWAMRGTLHMVAAEDLGWLVGLLGPHFAKRTAPRRRQLGLDEATCERGVQAIVEVLGNAALTRAQIIERIAGHGVRLDPKTQAPAHLLAYAALTATICRGPEAEGEEPTYVRTAEQLRVPEEEALARLAQRYLEGYGPAQAEDFAAWSGLPLTKARAGFTATDATPAQNTTTAVRLLGHFDTYLLGYRSRELAVAKEFDRRIQTGGGFIMPAVLVDGQAVGTWRHTRKQGRLMIDIEPFATIPGRAWPGIRAEVADVGRFLGVPAELTGNPSS